MTPALARLKRALREDTDRCGGIDGVAATVSRSRSTVGDWHNLNSEAFPPADCLLALSEAVIATGHRPATLHAMAAELAHALTALPAVADADALTSGVLEMVTELGDVTEALRVMDADKIRKVFEMEHMLAQVRDVLRVGTGIESMLVALIAAAASPSPRPSPPKEGEGA